MKLRHGARAILGSVAIMIGFGRAAVGEQQAFSAPLRVAIFADAGAAKKGSPHLKRCLAKEFGYEFELVTGDAIRNGALERFDVILHPGGSGSQQAKSLGDDGRERVREFVENGGGYVGICAGSYLVSADYPWSLGLLDAKVVDREHWARGNGNVEMRLEPAGRALFGVNDEQVTVFYGQGPLLAPADNDDIPDYEALAIYSTEIAKNGASAGVMKGTTAMARAPFGKGRVVAISPHPEKTKGREDFIRAAVRWAAGEEVE